MTLSAFTTASTDAPPLKDALLLRPFLVVGLCAAWCNTCAEFREGFERLAGARPDATFVWLDIEDDAAVAGDIDVENFPTIGVFHRGRLLHFGVSLPQSALLARLLDALSAASKTIHAEDAITQLAERIETAASRGD